MTCVHPPYPSTVGASKAIVPASTVKASSLVVTGGKRLVLEPPKTTFSENCRYLIFLAILGNLHRQGMPLIYLHSQSLSSENDLFCVNIVQKQTVAIV